VGEHHAGLIRVVARDEGGKIRGRAVRSRMAGGLVCIILEGRSAGGPEILGGHRGRAPDEVVHKPLFTRATEVHAYYYFRGPRWARRHRCGPGLTTV